ncbi:MAG TPA: hypothetical protein V6D21_11285 [Candidatus Obscuribacterales bacterium]
MTLTELKAKATELGLTPDEVRQYGSLSKKATWEVAIAKFEEMKITVNAHCEAMGITQWSYPDDDAKQTEPEPSTDITVTPTPPTDDDLPFDNPTHTLIDGEWVLCSEIVDPENLPNLKKTDSRFEAWEPWMMPGATFTTCQQTYEILYFDHYGNCLCKGADGFWPAFRIETIVNYATDHSAKKSEPIPPIKPDGGMGGWHRWDGKLNQWVKEHPDQLLKDCYQPESEPLRKQLLKRMEPYVGVTMTDREFETLKHEPLDEDTATVFLTLLEESGRMLSEALAL